LIQLGSKLTEQHNKQKNQLSFSYTFFSIAE